MLTPNTPPRSRPDVVVRSFQATEQGGGRAAGLVGRPPLRVPPGARQVRELAARHASPARAQSTHPVVGAGRSISGRSYTPKHRVARQQRGDRGFSLCESHSRGGARLSCLAELLLRAQPVKTRTFAFPLPRAQHLDHPLDLARCASRRPEAALVLPAAAPGRRRPPRAIPRGARLDPLPPPRSPRHQHAPAHVRTPNSGSDCSACRNSVNPAPSRLYINLGLG